MNATHSALEGCQAFPNLEDFYRQDSQRRYSGEADYGVHWTLPGSNLRYRVSYVRNTGEIYAVPNLSPNEAKVFLIGQVPADPVEDEPKSWPTRRWYATLDAILDGWPSRYGEPGGLQWLLERLAPHPAGT